MNLKRRFTPKAEKEFLLDILRPYRLVVISFLFASVLASIFDGISIGLLIPLLSHLQDNPAEIPIAALIIMINNA